MNSRPADERLRRPLFASILAICATMFAAGCKEEAEPPAAAPTPPPAQADPTPQRNVTITQAGGPPQMNFDRLHHDFGAIWDTESHPCEFHFSNTGGSILRIRRIVSSCTCTTASPDKWAYAPGDWGTISTVFEPKDGGADTETITILTNLPTEPTIKLTIQSVVNQFVTFDRRMLAFGVVERGVEHKRRFSLTGRCTDMVIHSIESTNPYVTGEVVELDAQRGRATVEVTIAGDAPWGRLRLAKLNLDVRGRREDGVDAQKVAGMLVAGDVLDDIRADPLHVSLGLLARGARFTKEVKISSASGSPFKIVDARIKDAQLADVTVTVEPDRENFYGGYRIIIDGTAGAEDGMVLALIEFETDDRELREIQVIGKIGT